MTVLLGWSGRRYRQSLHGGDAHLLAASGFVLGGSRGPDAEGAAGSAIGCTIRRETGKVDQCRNGRNAPTAIVGIIVLIPVPTILPFLLVVVSVLVILLAVAV